MKNSVKDNKTDVPFEYYKKRYREINPVIVGINCRVPYDDTTQEFRFCFFGRDVAVSYPELSARYIDSGDPLSAQETILLARFMLDGQLTASAGKYSAYREMPWGSLYDANFSGRCIARLAHSFGRDLERFRSAATALGGRPLDIGDVSFEIEFIKGLTLRIIFWEGDDEFAPSVQILFSSNFPSAFTAEDIAVVGDVTIDALKKAS